MSEKCFYDNAKRILFEYEYRLEIIEGLIKTNIPVHVETFMYLNNQIMMLKKLIEQYEKKKKLEEKERWKD